MSRSEAVTYSNRAGRWEGKDGSRDRPKTHPVVSASGGSGPAGMWNPSTGSAGAGGRGSRVHPRRGR